MNRIARFLLLSVFGTLSIGCGEDRPAANGRSAGDGSRQQSQPPKSERDAMKYTSAEVKFLSGDLANRTKRIKDQTEIQRLLSFFPGAGRGREGPEPPAPWVELLVIQVTRLDGTVLKVTSSYQFWHEEPIGASKTEFWSEGHGDWLLNDTKAFRSYIQKLFEEENKSAKPGDN